LSAARSFGVFCARPIVREEIDGAIRGVAAVVIAVCRAAREALGEPSAVEMADTSFEDDHADSRRLGNDAHDRM